MFCNTTIIVFKSTKLCFLLCDQIFTDPILNSILQSKYFINKLQPIYSNILFKIQNLEYFKYY